MKRDLPTTSAEAPGCTESATDTPRPSSHKKQRRERESISSLPPEMVEAILDNLSAFDLSACFAASRLFWARGPLRRYCVERVTLALGAVCPCERLLRDEHTRLSGHCCAPQAAVGVDPLNSVFPQARHIGHGASCLPMALVHAATLGKLELVRGLFDHARRLWFGTRPPCCVARSPCNQCTTFYAWIWPAPPATTNCPRPLCLAVAAALGGDHIDTVRYLVEHHAPLPLDINRAAFSQPQVELKDLQALYAASPDAYVHLLFASAAKRQFSDDPAQRRCEIALYSAQLREVVAASPDAQTRVRLRGLLQQTAQLLKSHASRCRPDAPREAATAGPQRVGVPVKQVIDNILAAGENLYCAAQRVANCGYVDMRLLLAYHKQQEQLHPKRKKPQAPATCLFEALAQGRLHEATELLKLFTFCWSNVDTGALLDRWVALPPSRAKEIIPQGRKIVRHFLAKVPKGSQPLLRRKMVARIAEEATKVPLMVRAVGRMLASTPPDFWMDSEVVIAMLAQRAPVALLDTLARQWGVPFGDNKFEFCKAAMAAQRIEVLKWFNDCIR